jgi:hypothetical protein
LIVVGVVSSTTMAWFPLARNSIHAAQDGALTVGHPPDGTHGNVVEPYLKVTRYVHPMSFGFGAKNANTYLARSVDTNFQFLLSDAASVSVSVTLVAWW